MDSCCGRTGRGCTSPSRCCTTRPALAGTRQRAPPFGLAQQHELRIVETTATAPRAGAPAAPGGARRAAAHDLRLWLFPRSSRPAGASVSVAAPAALVDRLSTLLLSALTTPALTEQAIAHCLERGLLRRHAERVTRDSTPPERARRDWPRRRAFRGATARPVRLVDAGVDTERLARNMLDAGGWHCLRRALFHATRAPSTLDAHQLRDGAGAALLARPRTRASDASALRRFVRRRARVAAAPGAGARTGWFR